jgi:hypothetical protein
VVQERKVSVNEFSELLDSSARIENRNNVDKIQTTVLKLTDFEMSEVTSIILCNFKQPGKGKRKSLNF